METPNQLIVDPDTAERGTPFVDPAIPYFMLGEEDRVKRRLPLYLWDCKKFDGIDLSESTPYLDSDYASFELFGDSVNTGTKGLLDTNMRVAGKVEKSSIYVITSFEGFITPTQRLNIWQHEYFYWCLAQGMIEFLLDNQVVLEFPFSRSIIGNFPHLSEFSLHANDMLGSSPDAVQWNMRYGVEAPRIGFVIGDAPIVCRAGVTIRANYRYNPECLAHYHDFLERYYQAFPPAPAKWLYVHDFFRIGLALRGRKYQNIEKPL